MGLAAFASVTPGFCKWSFAQNASAKQSNALVPAPVKGYTPVGFTTVDYATIEALCDRILPPDGGSPGAVAAGVAEFIDFFVSTDAGLAAQFGSGLAGLNALSRKVTGGTFANLNEAQQIQVLNRLAYRTKYQPGEEQAQQFFHLMRKYTVMGYYTSEAGFKALDSPSLRFYAESPGCPHPDDPEHMHAKDDKRR